MPRRKPTTENVRTDHQASFPTPAPVQFAQPVTWCNSTTTEPYLGPRWQPTRPGSEDHKRCKSRGF